MIVTVQGGWLDGKVIEIPDGRGDVILFEEPRPLPLTEWYTTAEAAELLSNQIRLPLEHIAEDQYLARWPVREDQRYCPQCACPPQTAQPTDDGWRCECRFVHAWTLHKRSLSHFPPSSWPRVIRPEFRFP